MENTYKEKAKYINIFNRIQKKFSTFEGILIIKKQYFTDNTFYYFLCILFRFIHLLIVSGDFLYTYRKKASLSTQEYLNILTCFNLFKKVNCSFQMYIIIIILIFILIIIKLICDYKFIHLLDMAFKTNKYPLPSKFRIILNHIEFLIFPFILEFLSFSYYIYLFPTKFIIKGKTNYSFIIFFIMFLSTILIIYFNIDNYINMRCSNRIFVTTSHDAYLNLNDLKRNIYKKPIVFKESAIILYSFVFLQNFVLFITVKEYLNIKYKLIFQIAISSILLLTIAIIFISRFEDFNYINLINSFIGIKFVYIFYSIIFDLIIFMKNYGIKNKLILVIFLIFKIFFSCITFFIFQIIKFNSLESKIVEILFQEKLDKKKKLLSKGLYLLHFCMIKIKEENNIEYAFSLIKIINKHINKCHKNICNCKLVNNFVDCTKVNDYKELKNQVSELLIILNYLFETTFLYYNFYDNFELSILLSEHYCHLQNNPILAFSIISTYLLKNKNKFSKFENIILYELSQKYIYYINEKIKIEVDKYIKNNILEIVAIKKSEKELRDYFINLKLSNITKKLIYDYISIYLKLLKYKNVFDDSCSFQFDENNDIVSININFFDKTTKIDNFNKKEHLNNNISINENHSNLLNILYLLRKESFYYKEIINSIKLIDIKNSLPNFIIFKFFLFFDIFGGGKVPTQIKDNLFQFLNISNIDSYYGIITLDEYTILKKQYNKENNSINARNYIIFQLKKDFRTKYFGEDAALKLGYSQKDLINNSIDLLMPRHFSIAHTSVIKSVVIGCQLKYNIANVSYYFDKSSSILYPADFIGALLPDISKSLFVMLVSNFTYQNEYRFMLDNNFELLAYSKNFEDEYFLNKKIFEKFDIKFLDLFKIKPEKINEIYGKQLKFIKYNNDVRYAKTQENLIPEFYPSCGNKNAVGIKNFKISKNKYLSQILVQRFKDKDLNENNDEEIEDNEEKSLLQNTNAKDRINEFFIKPAEALFHRIIQFNINKTRFINNLAKELVKISENDLKYENDMKSYNLVVQAKMLVEKLLTKNDLANEFVTMTIKFSYYYDRPFFFIAVNDKYKSYIDYTKTIHFQNEQILNFDSSPLFDIKEPIPYNKNVKKFKSKNLLLKSLSRNNKKSMIDKKEESNIKTYIPSHIDTENDKNKVLNIINDYKIKINKDRFIFIIRLISSLIIFLILLIYVLMIIFQMSSISVFELTLIVYYYNFYTRNLILGIFSIIIQSYYDSYILEPKGEINEINNHYLLMNLTAELSDKYHNLSEFYFSYNIAIKDQNNLLYKKRHFMKLRGYWQGIEYESKLSSEVDFVIFNILQLNLTFNNIDKEDFKNFLFFKENNKEIDKVKSTFIKLLYYLTTNSVFAYREIFTEFEENIYNSFKKYIDFNFFIYNILEIFALILYIIFYIIAFTYLYLSNDIIFKNIILLFLDFSEKNYNKDNKTNIASNIISLKLLEFNNLIDDFDLNRFDDYIKKLENLDKIKIHNLNNQSLNAILNNSFDKNKSLNKALVKSKNSYKEKDKNNVLNKENNLNINSSLPKLISKLDHKTNDIDNSSSQNYLMNSNSNYFKDKLINKNKENLLNNGKNNSNIVKNSLISKEKIYENEVNDLILNKSKKSLILMIKIYFIIMILILLFTSGFIYYKIVNILSFKTKFNQIFIDIPILTNRYSIIYQYFNAFRTLLIYPPGKIKVLLENTMEHLNEYYEKENNKYNKILSSDLNNYVEIKELFQILKVSKNNYTNVLKEKICENQYSCTTYLDSSLNIFDSGVDFAYKACIIQMNNLFSEYKKLSNNTDINEINSTLIYSQNSKFIPIAMSLNYMFLFIIKKIFNNFEMDGIRILQSYLSLMTSLNFLSIIFTFIIFLFLIIFIIISIIKYTEPIKDSAYRINCSFYYIKSYYISIHKKKDSFISINI